MFESFVFCWVLHACVNASLSIPSEEKQYVASGGRCITASDGIRRAKSYGQSSLALSFVTSTSEVLLSLTISVATATMCLPCCWPFADVWLEDPEPPRPQKRRRHSVSSRSQKVSAPSVSVSFIKPSRNKRHATSNKHKHSTIPLQRAHRRPPRSTFTYEAPREQRHHDCRRR